MNTWPQVDKLQNGDPINADTLNTPVEQLAARTDYLKRRLDISVEKSSVILSGVDLGTDVVVGDIVYRGADCFEKAQAKMHIYDDFTAADSAFTVGVVVLSNGESGDVLVSGKLSFGTDFKTQVSSMLEDGELYRDGRYYLSSTEPGKITAHPNGPLVYVGSFHKDDGAAYVNPQFLDIGTSHIHRAYRLASGPVGAVEGGHVIGILPDGASESSSSGETDLPTILFGGTWTNAESPLTYKFTLSESGAWGEATLSWSVNGSSTVSSVKVPASGVFVDLDDGLKAAVRFPSADSSHAYSGLSVAERTWTVSLPDDGQGWVDHRTDAILSDTSGSSSDESSPVHVAVYGGWPSAGNKVCCIFPRQLYMKNIASLAAATSIKIGSTTYTFIDDEASSYVGVPVLKGATLSETLYNLASKANTGFSDATVFYTPVETDACVYSTEQITGGGSEACYDFNVVGCSTISPAVVYAADYSVIGKFGTSTEQLTYRPIALGGGLVAVVYAEGATASRNVTVRMGTRLFGAVYDYSGKAVYDYVMGLHQDIDAVFPPVPAASAGLFANGVELENAELFPDRPVYKVGHDTIHWMSSERAPWSASRSLDFHFVSGFQCATGPVTSIRPAPDAPIKITTYGTDSEATTGDLMVDVDFDLNVVDAGVSGFNVAKQGRGGRVLAGPVVERVRAGNGILVTQDAGCPAGQGTVTVSLDNGTLRGSFNEIALENAKQEKLGLFPYISLLGWSGSNSIPSAFTMMTRVATSLDAAKKYVLQLRLVMFGTTGYSGAARRAAGLQLEYSILPDLTGSDVHKDLKNGLITPSSARQIAVPLGHSSGGSWSYTAYDPFVATTDASIEKKPDVCVALTDIPIPSVSEFTGKTLDDIALRPGFLVAVRLSRAATPDGDYTPYTSPIGFLSLEWTLKEA